jgi:iron complex outermembrane receptor protein
MAKNCTTFRYSILSIIAIFVAAPASAQLEEIVVTAQKREESLQEVPITISALTAEQFDIFNVTRADDLEFVFANVGTNRNSSGNTGISIRGVGTDNVHLSGQQSVGTYIDDVSTVSPFVSAIAVYDMNRVEVLRGPQNTLYGRNTTGGAVIWHSNKANPGDGTNGYGRVRAGDGGLLRFEGAIGFDMGDNWAGRVALLTDEFDGLWKNVVDGKDTGGAYDRTGGRFNITWDNDNGSRMELTVSTGELEGEDLPVRMSGDRLADGTIDPDFTNRRADKLTGRDNNYVIATAADVAATPWLQDQYNQGTGVVIDNPNPIGAFNRLINYSTPLGWTYEDPEDGYEAEWDGIRLNFEWDFENVMLSSLTSYDETWVIEKNGQELTGFSPSREGSWKVWQQELRWTSTTDSAVQWLAGLYFTGSDSNEDTWVSNTAGAGGMGVRPGVDITSRYEAWSAYAQFDWSVSEALTLSLGLRHTDDELSADNDNWVRTVCGFFPSAVGSIEQTREYREAGCPGAIRLAGNTDSPVQELSEIGWRIGADYQFGDASMIFFSASKGFKGGSYDNRALSTGDDPIGPEFLTAYELGYKSTFADGKVQLNAAYYFYDWEDLQLFESYGGIPALVNVPGIEIKGLEVELKWAPTDNFYLQGGLGTADSKVVDIKGLNPASQAQVGKEVTNTPDTTANILASYSLPIGGNSLDLSLNYRYTSSMYYTFVQDNARDESSSYSFLNARAAYNFGQDEEFMLALWGNNLTEEFACSSVIWGPGAAPGGNFSCEVATFGEAMFGLTFEANFGN